MPATETQGRVHTSTATVAIMPEVDEVAVETAATTVVASALLGLPDVVQRR